MVPRTIPDDGLTLAVAQEMETEERPATLIVGNEGEGAVYLPGKTTLEVAREMGGTGKEV